MKPPLTDDLRTALLEFLYLLTRAKRLYRTNVKYAAQADDAWDELIALMKDAALHTRQLLDEDSTTRGTRSGLKLFPGILGGEREGSSEIRARRSLTMRSPMPPPSRAAGRPSAGRSLH